MQRQRLKMVCKAIDDCDVIARQIDAEGLVHRKSGKVLVHPAHRTELTLIRFIAKMLGDLFPIDKPKRPVGRPPTGVGITWRQLPDRSR